MNAGGPIRALLPPLAFALSIAAGWDWLIDALGQGSTYLYAGWFASLLGLVVVVMGLMVPIAGLAGAFVLAWLLRCREQPSAPSPGAVGTYASSLLAFITYTGVVTAVLWRLSPPTATEDAHYGAAFAWTGIVLGLVLSVAGGIYSAKIIQRH